MRKRIAVGLAALTAGFVIMFGTTGDAVAQKDKDKVPAKVESNPPKFLYGHDLRVRPGGDPDWVKAAKLGMEVFQDDNTNALVGISEAGSLAVIHKININPDRTATWKFAHDLAVRKAGEPDFTAKTKKFGTEVFQDKGAGRLLYVNETGAIAFAPILPGQVDSKGPKWHHALEPRVRAPDQGDFANAKRVGLEVFKDENTGGLVYITETGGISTGTAPATEPDPKKLFPPKAEYGLVLRVRGATEADFTEKTKRIGVEVFSDPNANNQLFYITEAGSIAVAPNPGKFLDKTNVTWKSAMALKARKGGEKDFEKAKKYGIEVFEDNRTGHLIFICENGSIAVLPK